MATHFQSSPSGGSFNRRKPFTLDSLDDFLKNGWLVALDSNQILLGWGEWRTSATQPEGAGASLFAPDFYLLGREVWRHTPNWEILEREVMTNLVLSGLGRDVNGEEHGFQWVEPNLEAFQRQFESIREGMRSRGLKKAVPVVFGTAQGEMNSTRKLTILAGMLTQPKHLFPYAYWHEEDGMMGVTPEILFSQSEPLSLESVALAGTRGKGGDTPAAAMAAELLLQDPKERHEHQLVIDDIQTVLNAFGEAQVAVTGVVDLPTLVHLKTSIHASLDRPRKFEEIARQLHPTPALGVSPRSLGFTEMRRWEATEPRLSYGAPFGVSLTGEELERRHCLVAIRNIQWRGRNILLGSGCGIVAESDCDREWQELRLKRESVKRMLGV